MPISQTRMIALIEAALAFKRSRETLTENINHWAELAFAGELTMEEALGKISQAALLAPDGEHYEVIGAERAHFQRVAAKNIRDQTRRQARLGLTADPHVTRATTAQVLAHMRQNSPNGTPPAPKGRKKPSTVAPTKSLPSTQLADGTLAADLDGAKVTIDMGDSVAFSDNTGDFTDITFGPTAVDTPHPMDTPLQHSTLPHSIPSDPFAPTQADLAEDSRLAEEAMAELEALRAAASQGIGAWKRLAPASATHAGTPAHPGEPTPTISESQP
jgi:hypothetical protein